MHCPFCHAKDTKVTDSRLILNGSEIRRRRLCLSCSARFITYEHIALQMPQVIKRDQSRIPFAEEKLKNGILRALEKRPVSVDKIEELIASLMRRIRETGEKEIHSELIGEWVMQGLRLLDEVAYVRFASVYRRFADVDAFRKEIDALESE